MPSFSAKSKTVKLSSGADMPVIGIGTWHHGKQSEMQDAIRFAIRNGYRHIDGAHIYLNEDEVGEVYKEMIGKEVKREDMFLTSKLWNTHHEPEHVEEALRATLTKLNLEYLDLYYIHWPVAFKYGDKNVPQDDKGYAVYADVDYVETYKAMEKLVEKGLVRSLGVCNFNCLQMKRLLKEATIPPAVLQIESNPRIHNEILRRFCLKHDICMVGYSPFGSPDLPWGEKLPHILVDETIKIIANKHGKSTAQVILRWQLQRGVVVIPKSVYESELLSNLAVYDFNLDSSDMTLIQSLDRNLRKINPIVKLRDGTVVSRDNGSKYYSFDHHENEECLLD